MHRSATYSLQDSYPLPKVHGSATWSLKDTNLLLTACKDTDILPKAYRTLIRYLQTRYRQPKANRSRICYIKLQDVNLLHSAYNRTRICFTKLQEKDLQSKATGRVSDTICQLDTLLRKAYKIRIFYLKPTGQGSAA